MIFRDLNMCYTPNSVHCYISLFSNKTIVTVNNHVERRDPSLYFIRTICLDLAFQISITSSLFCKIILQNKLNLKFNPHECSSKFNNLEYIYGKQKRQTLICRHQQIHKLFNGKLETLIPVRTIEGKKKKKKR